MSSKTDCQVSGCSSSQFTYCPHCSLSVCIKCLNEHYILMKNDYKQYLINFQTELNINRQQNRDEQYEISKRLSENEATQYDRFSKFLSNKIDQNGKLIMKNFHPTDYIELKTNFTLLVENHQKFNRLLEQINQLIGHFETEASHSSEMISTSWESNLDDKFPMPKSESVLTIESDNEDYSEEQSSIGGLKSFIENHISHVNMIGDTTIHSNYLNQDENPLKPGETYSAKQLKHMFFPCPLIKYKFGLQKHHHQENGITNIPCRYSHEKKCCLFTHLHHHHVLNTQSALKIIRAVLFLPDHLDQLDLFSNESIDSLIGNAILSYTGVCPLVKHGVFGILPEHKIKLCNKNRQKKIILHYHFRTTHRIAHQYATQLVRAIKNNMDEKTPIIGANDQILLIRQSAD